MMSCPKILLPLVFGTFLYATPALADEADAFNVNANFTSMRDNNLFRLPSSVDPKDVGLSSRSDTINVTSLDLSLDRRFSLQRVIAKVSLVDTRYQTNDYLDFRALNYDAKWLWAVGLRWDGELSFDRKEALNSFSDYRNFQQRNVRTTENERFNANYWFHSSWAVVGGVFRTSLTNEQPFLAESDYTGVGYNLGMRYRPASGNILTARFSRLDGEYTKRDFNVVNQSDNGFTEDVYSLDMNWQASGKSFVRGRLGYLDRQHDHFDQRDYSGVIGNLDYTYAYTGKGSVTLGYKRELSSFQQLTTSYYTLDEINLSGRWLATSKLSTLTRFGYGRRDYDGSIVNLPASFDQRRDLYSRLGFEVTYQPARWFQMTAGISFENRNVNNNDLQDYKDRTGFITASAQY